jgi:hypothetical protein
MVQTGSSEYGFVGITIKVVMTFVRYNICAHVWYRLVQVWFYNSISNPVGSVEDIVKNYIKFNRDAFCRSTLRDFITKHGTDKTNSWLQNFAMF